MACARFIIQARHDLFKNVFTIKAEHESQSRKPTFFNFFFAGFAYFCQTFVSKQSFETWGRTDKKQIVEFSLCLFDFKLFNRVARHYAVRE